METIAEHDGIKMFVGSKARIVADAEGKVLMHKAAGTRPTMTFCPSTHTMKTGTDKEIADEKIVQDSLVEKVVK